ncbi:RagB/SusD family nutrient uptake outer membrane protein [Carboxylicivirga sp. RSCT41]|uniref:RagB/SusD family nutrient uptake outer membrane protein n=1 Tax=Carboxylicivirga agarovorans TaxID=3417570 RepID=UPI003D3542D8
MKLTYIIPVFLLLVFSLVSCSEDYLNLAPKDELSEATTFNSYSSILVYSHGFYDGFIGYDHQSLLRYKEVNSSKRPAVSRVMRKDCEADLMQNYGWANGAPYLWNNFEVPSSSEEFYERPYRRIRRVNIMLDNLLSSTMAQEDIDHWRSVGLFFRAYEYYKLMNLYGDVIWLENEVTDEDTDILFGPRTPRDEVAANVLRDLSWAEEHIKPEGDGANTINTDVVNFLISRFGLFEGTWRKYHALGDANTYLDASIAASEKLMTKHPDLHPSFDEVFNSESLADVKGIVLYRRYVEDVLVSRMSTDFRSSNSTYDITRKGVDKFLSKNGLPVTNPANPQFGGYKDKNAEFRDRDDRLYFTTPPPYKVNVSQNVNWTHTGVPADQEYFAVMEEISDGLHKTLPDLNWAGNVVAEVPHFEPKPYNKTKATGYRIWKHYNQLNTGRSSADFADAPIFRMAEILLNYAEAKFEVGEFDQAVADATINKLRDRGRVAHMVMANIDAAFDPSRDADVDPVLFEIRRERAVELMGEGFRRDDLRRWKKMDYATDIKLGRWVKQADYKINIKIQDNAAEGFCQFVTGTPPVFPDYYYLFPLPENELALNPQLDQNPTWK